MKYYIVRFDDICETMNWAIWEGIVQILDKYDVKPIIAVIPNNKDKSQVLSPAKSDFWNRIREYQKKGWMIALHGYDHVYTNKSAGILGISANSEFCGLSYEQQKQKICEGVSIFDKENVRVDAFIAPSHSFDKTTLKVLKEQNIEVISDGHVRFPYMYKGFKWIPCQKWGFYAKRKGVYTVCLHPNTWNNDRLLKFEEEIKENISSIISPFEISDVKEITLLQKVGTAIMVFKFKMLRVINKLRLRKRK